LAVLLQPRLAWESSAARLRRVLNTDIGLLFGLDFLSSILPRSAFRDAGASGLATTQGAWEPENGNSCLVPTCLEAVKELAKTPIFHL